MILQTFYSQDQGYYEKIRGYSHKIRIHQRSGKEIQLKVVSSSILFLLVYSIVQKFMQSKMVLNALRAIAVEAKREDDQWRIRFNHEFYQIFDDFDVSDLIRTSAW